VYSRPALDPAAGRTFSDAASREENSGRTRANPSRPPDGLLFLWKVFVKFVETYEHRWASLTRNLTS
jgi:hypothetical protein